MLDVSADVVFVCGVECVMDLHMVESFKPTFRTLFMYLSRRTEQNISYTGQIPLD